ncbi:MAG: hypothetical protein WC626_13870 [Methanoregula sp.]
MDTQKNSIQEGSLVVWDPHNLIQIFSENTAFSFTDMVPVPGIVKCINGDIGLLSYMQRSGQKGEIPVKLCELVQAGVA